jgi:hypothetical protein
MLEERGGLDVPKRLQAVEWRWASGRVRTAATAAGGTCRAAGEEETMNSNRQKCKIKIKYDSTVRQSRRRGVRQLGRGPRQSGERGVDEKEGGMDGKARTRVTLE